MVAQGSLAARPQDGPRNWASVVIQKLGGHLGHLEAMGGQGQVHKEKGIYFWEFAAMHFQGALIVSNTFLLLSSNQESCRRITQSPVWLHKPGTCRPRFGSICSISMDLGQSPALSDSPDPLVEKGGVSSFLSEVPRGWKQCPTSAWHRGEAHDGEVYLYSWSWLSHLEMLFCPLC